MLREWSLPPVKLYEERMAYTMMTTTYGFGTHLDLPYEEAIPRVKEALKAEGFGVLTEIDVRKTMREKLGAESARKTGRPPSTVLPLMALSLPWSSCKSSSVIGASKPSVRSSLMCGSAMRPSRC